MYKEWKHERCYKGERNITSLNLDANDKLQEIRDKSKRVFTKEKSTIQDVAWISIYNSFYFIAITPPGVEGAAEYKCQGRITCRLERYLRAFGDYSLLRQKPGFQRYFEIYKNGDITSKK